MRKEEEKEKNKSEAATGSLMAADNGYAECYPGTLGNSVHRKSIGANVYFENYMEKIRIF